MFALRITRVAILSIQRTAGLLNSTTVVLLTVAFSYVLMCTAVRDVKDIRTLEGVVLV